MDINLQKAPPPPMREPRTNPEYSVLKRAFDWWPYVFIAVSVTGLTYIALSAAR